MKSVTKEILGFNVQVSGVAETLAEAVAAAGGGDAGEQRVLSAVNNYVLFHQHFSKLRNLIVAKLEKSTGISRLKDSDEVITEKDVAYIGRLEEEGVALAGLEAEISDAVAAVPVNYAAPVRGEGGSTKVAKKWLAYVDALEQAGKVEGFINKHKLADTLEGLDEEGRKVVIANKIREVVTAAEKAAAQSMLASV